MRFIYSLLIAILILLVAAFAFQNLRPVTVNLLTLQITLPLSLLIGSVYFLGLLTGGALITVVRSWVRGARRPRH